VRFTALCFTLVVAASILNTRIVYAVYVNGSEVGSAGSATQASAIVKDAEEQLAEILGYSYSLEESVSVSATLRPPVTLPKEVENALISSVDGVTELYAIVSNGEVIGAGENESVMGDLLKSILDDYTTQDTQSIRFIEDVTVERRFVSDMVTRDTDEIISLLDPNGNSKYALHTLSVELQTRSEDIPFGLETREDAELYEGESVVAAEGDAGVKTVSERVVLINGAEQSRTPADAVIEREPATRVVLSGTKVRETTASYGVYDWPTDGVVTSGFGFRTVSVGSTNHKGIDIGGSYGQSINASDGGVVVFAGDCSGYGNLVRILHDNGDETYYGHNSELLVSEGERVYRGQQIALMGATGVATGVHCHFEIRVNGEPVDPMEWLGN
jgi:murein DD-endopeptidase MepM/ murein hydrolase activator NlpD